MQHSGEELVYNDQSKCVRERRRERENREREREISRQFYLTESFYQSAQQRQKEDKSLTSEATVVLPHTKIQTHTHMHIHRQINP